MRIPLNLPFGNYSANITSVEYFDGAWKQGTDIVFLSFAKFMFYIYFKGITATKPSENIPILVRVNATFTRNN